MASALPRIIILFAGGAALPLEDGTVFRVETEKDLRQWASYVPELGLIAQIEPIFVLPDGEQVTTALWNRIGKAVQDNYDAADGVVILHGMDGVLYTGAYLSYALRNLGKPVVITGSPVLAGDTAEGESDAGLIQYKALGMRANLLNAVQVATMNLSEVTLVFGNQVLRANRSRLATTPTFNVVEADEEDVLGRVDFGIKLKVPGKRHKGKVEYAALGHASVAVVTVHPGYQSADFSRLLDTQPAGVILKLEGAATLPQPLVAYLKVAEQRGIPVVLFNGVEPSGAKGAALVIRHVHFEALYAKFLWAVSTQRNREDIFRVLQQNVAGEAGVTSPGE